MMVLVRGLLHGGLWRRVRVRGWGVCARAAAAVRRQLVRRRRTRARSATQHINHERLKALVYCTNLLS